MTNNTGWFDPETGFLRLDEHIMNMPSYQRIVSDGVVTEEEIAEHGIRVTGLLRQLDGLLTQQAHAVATEALCELAVLYAIQRQYGIQSASTRSFS